MQKIADNTRLITNHIAGHVMVKTGTPLTASATKILLLGSGELGKEIAIEAQRLGIEVIAVDRYENAPAMQVAHKCYVISMLDARLREIINEEKPHFIVPEVEAIATEVLLECERDGFNVIPSAKATHLTMNRAGIRRLAAEELKLKTSPYQFASNYEEYQQAIKNIGIPCVIKPIMSSSGKGQSILRDSNESLLAWEYATSAGRAQTNDVIVEAFIPFDYEITLLTIRHINGTSFCAPIGHLQVDGDYRESWQPHSMPEVILQEAQRMAQLVTESLGGYGLFGVEFFIKDDIVYFSEVSPRPHDTGLVTLASQNLSEFALHVRAILGLPIPTIKQLGCAASSAIIAEGEGKIIEYNNMEKVLSQPETYLRIFAKPEINGKRRMAVTVALDETIEGARKKATQAANLLSIIVN